MRLHRRSAVIALLLLAIFAAASAPARGDEIDDYVKAEMQRQKIPGLSLAVVRDGQVVKAQGYGLANVELNAAATPETIYLRLGRQTVHRDAGDDARRRGQAEPRRPDRQAHRRRAAHLAGHHRPPPAEPTRRGSRTASTRRSTCAGTTPRRSWSRRSGRCRSTSSPANDGATATPAT